MQIVDTISEALGEPRKKPANRTRAARILVGLSEEYVPTSPSLLSAASKRSSAARAA